MSSTTCTRVEYTYVSRKAIQLPETQRWAARKVGIGKVVSKCYGSERETRAALLCRSEMLVLAQGRAFFSFVKPATEARVGFWLGLERGMDVDLFWRFSVIVVLYALLMFRVGP